jgi:hypothetical protein
MVRKLEAPSRVIEDMGRISARLWPCLLLGAACGTDVIDHSDCFRGLIEAPSSGGTDLEIRTVSEYGGRPIGRVAVQINGQAWMTTDDEGHLSVPTPDVPYTLVIHQVIGKVEPLSGGYEFHDVWEYRNLSGYSLTARVDGSAIETRSAKVAGAVAPVREGQQVRVFVPDHDLGSRGTSSTLADGTGAFELDVSWEGKTRAIKVHALASDPAQPPARYFGYGSAELELTENLDEQPELELQPVEEARVSGTVTGPEGLSIEATLSLQVDNDNLTLGSQTAGDTFEYVFPRIEDARAHLTMSSFSQDSSATYHSKRVELPSSRVAFELPSPAVQLEPTEGSTVAPAATTFSWTPVPAGGTHELNFSCSWRDGESNAYNVHMMVIDAGQQTTLPAIPDLTISPLADCAWNVYWFAAPNADERKYSASARRTLHVAE